MSVLLQPSGINVSQLQALRTGVVHSSQAVLLSPLSAVVACCAPRPDECWFGRDSALRALAVLEHRALGIPSIGVNDLPAWLGIDKVSPGAEHADHPEVLALWAEHQNDADFSALVAKMYALISRLISDRSES